MFGNDLHEYRTNADRQFGFCAARYGRAEILPRGLCRLKVLIVDDSQVLREKLTEMVSQVRGLEVVGEAEGVADALRAINELKPGLVILDLQLRDGNGLEVLRKTKQIHPSIKLVVFTNQPEMQYRQRCADLGADYFLCKSTDAKALITIGEILVAEIS
jgi:DNA-binding NarL/FixJ family response regulator